MAITLGEVAQRAGVSASTVSRVVNNYKTGVRISSGTRSHVLRIVKETGYRPHVFGQALKTGRSRTLGLVIFDALDPHYMEVLRGAEEVINSMGYNFLLSDVQNDEARLRSYLSTFLQRKVDGMLMIANSFLLTDRTIMDVTKEETPLVIIGRDIKGSCARCIRIDNFEGGFSAVEHLIKLGHKKIGFIVGPPEIVDSLERLNGGKTALKKHGLDYDERLVEQEEDVESCSSPNYGYQAMGRILEKGTLPTAVFAFDDITAFGAIRCLGEKGLRVPEDVSVVGFDDIRVAAYYNPPLTTVRQPMLGMGKRAAELLLEMVELRSDIGKAETVIVQPELVVRSSTCQCGEERRKGGME